MHPSGNDDILIWTAHIEYTVKKVNTAVRQVTRFKRLVAPKEKNSTFSLF